VPAVYPQGILSSSNNFLTQATTMRTRTMMMMKMKMRQMRVSLMLATIQGDSFQASFRLKLTISNSHKLDRILPTTKLGSKSISSSTLAALNHKGRIEVPPSSNSNNSQEGNRILRVLMVGSNSNIILITFSSVLREETNFLNNPIPSLRVQMEAKFPPLISRVQVPLFQISRTFSRMYKEQWARSP